MKALNNNESASTLGDVASEAGVSSATVSRYLNNPALVSQRSKQKIAEAIATLNYVPHAAARALASRRSRMIGAVLPSLDSSLFGVTLESFQTALAAAGYTLVAASHNYDETQEQAQIRQLVASGVDGIILVGNQRAAEIYAYLRQQAVPYVLLFISETEAGDPCVGFDNLAAARRVTEYLIDLGHRDIAVVSGPLKTNDRAASRIAGVCEALQSHGLSLRDEWLVEKTFGVEQGREAFRALMDSATPPTAIICGSELFAYGAVFEAASMGLQIPGHVSITGFDDLWLAAQLTPALTTVRTPQQRIGQVAAEYLLAILAGEAPGLPRPMSVELIVRDSVVKPVR